MAAMICHEQERAVRRDVGAPIDPQPHVAAEQRGAERVGQTLDQRAANGG